jgi:glycogen synthase
MRLLVVSNLYPPNVVGGYERLCFDAVSGLVRRGHEVTVLTSTFGGKTAEFPGQAVERSLQLLVGDGIYAPFAGTAADREAINRANLAALQRTVAALRPDAIFAWNLFFLDRSIVDGLGAAGCPVHVMLTDNWLITMYRPEFWAGFFQKHVLGNEPFVPPSAAAPGPGEAAGLRARAWGWLRRLLGSPAAAGPVEPDLRFPFRAVFGSRFVRDLYRAAGIGFAGETVVYNGVQQAPYADKPVRERSILVDPDELRLLFVGRLVDLKGVDTVVEALALLGPRDLGVSRVRLSIVGDMQDAAYVRHLRELIDRSGRAGQVTIQLAVPEETLFDLFQAHDIYLFPSLYEPFSLTLIHALACGIPTIATRAGGNVEIVFDGETGMLFEKGSAADLARLVRLLVRDPALRGRVAGAGRELARGFTVDRMVGEMEGILLHGAGNDGAGRQPVGV